MCHSTIKAPVRAAIAARYCSQHPRASDGHQMYMKKHLVLSQLIFICLAKTIYFWQKPVELHLNYLKQKRN